MSQDRNFPEEKGSNFWRESLPLAIVLITGLLVIVSFFAGAGVPAIKSLDDELQKWVQIIVNFAMMLGVLNLLKVNVKKIRRQVDGWGYNLVLVAGFLVMSMLGFVAGAEPQLKVGETVWMLGQEPFEGHAAEVLRLDREAGKEEAVLVRLSDGREMRTRAARLRSSLAFEMHLAFQVLFQGVYKAAQATMVSLLAFFVATASFRAFRVRSWETALLMGAAFVVMLGNVPICNTLNQWLAGFGLGFIDIAGMKEWLMSVPNSAAQSAILIGAVLGYMASALKILLGIDRSWLGRGN